MMGAASFSTPDRTAWREAVAEIADKAKAKLPECNGRVDSAVKIVLAGDVERFTGRDLQPPWAHIGTQMAPAAAVVESAPSGNGRALRGGRSGTEDTTPGSRSRPGGNARSRAGGNKGRKRGKR